MKKVAWAPVMTEREIAEEMGVTERMVKRYLYKAMRKLRDGRAERLRALAADAEYERGRPGVSSLRSADPGA